LSGFQKIDFVCGQIVSGELCAKSNDFTDSMVIEKAEKGFRLNKYNSKELAARISRLKKEKNAVILAHYYQQDQVQEIADFIGDSLALSRQAVETSAEIIVFAGVYFMAETAKILNPGRKVLLPDLRSGCSLADSCSAAELARVKAVYPHHVVVSYINCSAEVKAMSDVICTSANAEKIIQSIPTDKEILFVPDRNLGRYLQHKTGRKMVIWDGACVVHENFSIDKILQLHKDNPGAVLVAHPESDATILRAAAYVGSTRGMINFVKNDARDCFIVATEVGILRQMRIEVPHKRLIPAPVISDNTCACSECSFMKFSTLDNILSSLENEVFEIDVPAEVAAKALIPLRRMMEISDS
jgi:quinolinate synthase